MLNLNFLRTSPLLKPLRDWRWARFERQLIRQFQKYRGLGARFGRFRQPRTNSKYLLLIGFPEYQFGIGNVIRDTFNVIRQAGRRIALRPLPLSTDRDLISPEERQSLQPHFTNRSAACATWCFLDPRHIQLTRKALPDLFKDRPVMATLWWEYETGSELHFEKIIPQLDRVVCHSRFVREVLGQYTDPKKVFHLPYPFPGVVTTSPRHVLRSRWKFLPHQKIILFSFDYHSGLERKNPFAIVRVFKHLAKDFPEAQLVLKTSHGSHFPDERDRLLRAIQETGVSDQIRLLDVNLNLSDWADLQGCADLYVSLHRGEGLGLGMLESMWLGVPVVATAYGGNMDFMNQDTAALVPWSMETLSDPYLPYRHVKRAALANETEAWKIIAGLLSDPDGARALGERGRRHVLDLFHPNRLVREFNRFLDS